jgi:hypothetical protein
MKNKKWSYHKSHSFKEGENEFSGLTQLYQTGVYMIINNDSSMQFNFSPKDMVKMEKGLLKNAKAGQITDLKFGSPITVVEDENGFYKEME